GEGPGTAGSGRQTGGGRTGPTQGGRSRVPRALTTVISQFSDAPPTVVPRGTQRVRSPRGVLGHRVEMHGRQGETTERPSGHFGEQPTPMHARRRTEAVTVQQPLCVA